MIVYFSSRVLQLNPLIDTELEKKLGRITFYSSKQTATEEQKLKKPFCPQRNKRDAIRSNVLRGEERFFPPVLTTSWRRKLFRAKILETIKQKGKKEEKGIRRGEK